MFGPLSVGANGLVDAVARATQSAVNVVNASSTGENIEEAVVKMSMAKTSVDLSASVLKAENQMRKSLLDILV